MSEPFVVNVADAPALHHERGGWTTVLEPPEARFEQFGINIRVLVPGQPNGLYHREAMQEAFLVLGGECILILDGEERPLKQWDFVHCPPGTGHIFVGAGDGPCTILMVGARGDDGNGLHYPVDDVAAGHGASVAEETSDPPTAYADWGRDFTPGRLPWPPA
ncbi:MAG: hypothetical protein QOG94_1744 [Solirubrobacteraceae bacterium]|jgi:uncharacterized cupin superfamily protein|nr:hypothetical protein [Solirubrobacteraceae bacterium]MEA2138803.1 hypothetical protein [Solirubrobacteraceae bacterium]